MQTDVLDDLRHLPVETFRAGEALVEAGTASGKLFVLREGEVEVVRDGVVIGTVAEPGAVIGEISALLGQPHAADVRALRTSSFHVGEAGPMLRADPAMSLHVAVGLARRLHAVNSRVIEMQRETDARDGPRGAFDEDLDALARAILLGGPPV